LQTNDQKRVLRLSRIDEFSFSLYFRICMFLMTNLKTSNTNSERNSLAVIASVPSHYGYSLISSSGVTQQVFSITRS
jgi:hypothetical protein